MKELEKLKSAALLTDLSILFNQVTGLLSILNILFSVVIIIEGVVKRRDLDKYVANDSENGPDNWKVPLLIIFVLACSALAVYFTPYVWQGGLGWSTYMIPIACYAAEIYFVNDYRKVLANHVWKSWYWRSVMWLEWLVVATFVSSLVFMILARVTTDY